MVTIGGYSYPNDGYEEDSRGDPEELIAEHEAVFVRARGAGSFHLARVPRDAALCGQPRPRAGWWDVYQDLAWPEAVCLGCTNAAAREEAPRGED